MSRPELAGTQIGSFVPSDEANSEPTAVKAVERALDILSCFTLEMPEMGLVEICAETGLSKATVHRLLATLSMKKFVEQDPATSRYRLGTMLLGLGIVARSQMNYLDKAVPILRELVSEVDETVAVAVLDAGQHVCTWVSEPARPVRVTTAVGVRRPCYWGAAGLVLLAYQSERVLDELLPADRLQPFTVWSTTDPAEYRRRLSAVREQGYAIERGESFNDVTALAAPIFDHRGRVVAAPAIIAPTHRVPDDRVPILLKKIVDAANRISLDLGAPQQLLPDSSAAHVH